MEGTMGMEEKTKCCGFCENNCKEKENESKKKYCCVVSMENGRNARHCFMTGEYCSKQMNIQCERKYLHEKNSISAFVVMNFSNMSDVVYKWRLQDFVKSLAMLV